MLSNYRPYYLLVARVGNKARPKPSSEPFALSLATDSPNHI